MVTVEVKKNHLMVGAGVAMLAVVLFVWSPFGGDEVKVDGFAVAGAPTVTVGSDADMVVYKSMSCGCCGGFVSGMERKGYDVKTVNLDSLSSIKSRFNIPRNMQSCHTSVIGDYFVEGHMPIEAIEKLLAEKPDIDGIALPGMPSGSPGMPGAKTETWIVYALKDGVATEFMRV